jgi:cytochrome P450
MGFVEDFVALEIQRHPFFLRTALGLLQRNAPIAKAGKTVVVTGEAQVREVFSRPTDFLFGFGNGPKMKLGPFLFGMDASTQYFAEKQALHHVAIARDLPAQFGREVRTQALLAFSEIDKRINAGGRVDLLSTFIEPALLRAGACFYGVELEDVRKSSYLKAGNGEGTYFQWIRKLGGAVGSSWPAPFGLEALSTQLAPEMEAFLIGQVERQQRRPKPRTVIGALWNHGSSPNTSSDIARCVGGLMLAGAAAIKASTLALHELLRRPSAIERIDDATDDLGKRLAGNALLDDADEPVRKNAENVVLGYAWEALRFRPPFPFLSRYCPRATTLAVGTPYETPVPAGATVLVSPLAAMFDPLHTDRPEQFIPTRPANTYYLFGFGLHRCFGEQLAIRAIGELLTLLLASYRIEPGWIEYDGPAVARYEVKISRKASMPREESDATVRTDDPGAGTHRAA